MTNLQIKNKNFQKPVTIKLGKNNKIPADHSANILQPCVVNSEATRNKTESYYFTCIQMTNTFLKQKKNYDTTKLKNDSTNNLSIQIKNKIQFHVMKKAWNYIWTTILSLQFRRSIKELVCTWVLNLKTSI